MNESSNPSLHIIASEDG